MKAEYVGVQNCPVCKGEIVVWTFEVRGSMRSTFTHNGYTYVDRNVLTRECFAAKKAKEELEKR